MNLFKSTKATTYISSRGDKVYPIIMDIKTGIVEGDAVFTTGDIDTAYLYATILEEQSDYNILGSTVICNIQRPDGTTMKVQGDVLGNNLIEFPLGQSGVSQEGIYNFDIAVVFSEKKMVTSPTSQYSVTQSIEVIGEIEEDDRFPVLESLISGINVINEEELVRISNEEDRQSKEEAREQAESVRVRNEETRSANNEAIRNEEAVRVTSENERKNAESLRVQEENKRKQQENTRIAQENTRVSQETARVNAENTRKNQEATRQANEATRVSQETNRSQAESTRNSNETVRQNQENIRKNQEQARVTAEGNRVTSENVRVSAEQARVLKEQERQAIEVERQNSESTREQQEATRISQEHARKQADILRQQEHESRQQFLDGFEGKLNTVVDDVDGIKDDVVAVKEANKRQDVFLQGLYNENLDGRVTVKEEGSVISLTNSDNGLVDIVGLEGNTLVNYCVDGAKELTLNGDIDVEGTNVTLTEGVDNGLVDVICEGNTLVNIVSQANIVKNSNDYKHYQINSLIKPNTDYTIITPYSNEVKYRIANRNTSRYLTSWFRGNVKFNTGDNESIRVLYRFIDDNNVVNTNGVLTDEHDKVILLEGDWTNKEIPPCFEGMKSVAECEDNKIEIVGQSKNLFNTNNLYKDNTYIESGVECNATHMMTYEFDILPNTNYYYSNNENKAIYINLYNDDEFVRGFAGLSFNSSNCNKVRLSVFKDVICHQLEEGSQATSYVPYATNTHSIQLSEPLRALPNGVKDKIVKIDGKWYIQRNTGQILLNGDNNEKWVFESDWTSNSGELSRFLISIPNQKNILWHDLMRESKDYSINNRFNALENIAKTFALEVEHFTGWDFGKFVLNIKTSRLSIKNELGLKQWLSENPVELAYELETPIYEELPIDPTVNTYTDTTHISNNSTIPCNMTIKNTGYNAIIKPSTQYTVAFDTNTSGEVGISLGGSKVTTTNNFATVTTPSTLVDDSLRLYGKGIKASNIRLLEGDKTNWIPSYFEGMKSCFEDKLQDDGTYKMEILSNNSDNSNFNKIQFSSIEPLRGVGDAKDRFVFKDGKLIIQRSCSIREYQEGDYELSNVLTDEVNTVYILDIPIYEEIPFELQKIILEGYENGTLFLDTNIPPTVEVSYTANIPVVSELNKNSNEIGLTQEDLSVTQVAVDFLLMSNLGEEMLSSFNVNTKGRNSMGAYFANRITKGALKYEDVINKYPQYKEEIDLILETK